MRWRLTLLFLSAAFWTSAAHAESATDVRIVKIGIDQSSLPFADPDTDSGLEVEVIRAAFDSQNIRTRFEYLSNSRVDIEFSEQRLDVHTAVIAQSSFPNAVLSRFPITTYKNLVISLREKNLHPKRLSDLSNLRVMAWQGAKDALGDEYATMARGNRRYAESPILPAKMLDLDRVDFVVSQADIFRANLLKNAPKAEHTQILNRITYADLLPGTMRYRYAFRDTTLRDTFENGLAAIYRSGRMEALLAKYKSDFGTSRDYFIELDCRFLKHPPKCPK